MEPSRVVAPGDEQEVADILAAASREGQAVIPVGGGTMRSWGNPPRAYHLALTTQHLSGIVEYNPADLTVVARAGTTLDALDQALRAHEQYLPLDVPFPERATLGGALAANASGALRTAYGSARDMVIGMRMALPSGQVARSGGRVVKNVAGYDLAKLFIGSFGTLGVIVEVALKVYPRPRTMRTLVLTTPDLPMALALAARLRTLGPGLLALALVNSSLARELAMDRPAVIAAVGGTERAAAELAAVVRVEAERAAAGVQDQGAGSELLATLRDFPGSAGARISTLPTRVGEAFDLAPEHPMLSYPSVGLSYVRAPAWDTEAIRRERERLRRYGGSLGLLQADAAQKRAIDAWGTPGPELTLLRKVKDVFDPGHVMSPGRFIGGL